MSTIHNGNVMMSSSVALICLRVNRKLRIIKDMDMQMTFNHPNQLLFVSYACYLLPLLQITLQIFFAFELVCNHRLNGSLSPVLTATCLSYGSLCDFLVFSPTDLEVTPLDRF